MIKAILLDFGGVIAEEGFKKGLQAIGEKQKVEGLFETADRLIYEDGYVMGLCDERKFWQDLRDITGIEGTDAEFRREVLEKFNLRPEVLEAVDKARGKDIITAILSDQTNWLDEINERTPFFHHFDRVFNSFRMHKGKRDPTVFGDVCRELRVSPGEALFVDDKAANVGRAEASGMRAILFRDAGSFMEELGLILKESHVG